MSQQKSQHQKQQKPQQTTKHAQDPYAREGKQLASAVQRLRGWVGSDPSREPELADALVALTEHRLLGHGFAAAAADAQESVKLATRLLTASGPLGPYTSVPDAARYLTAVVHLAVIQSGAGLEEAAAETVGSLSELRDQLGELPLVQALEPVTVVWALTCAGRGALAAGEIGSANAYADAAQQRLGGSGLRAKGDEMAYLVMDADRLTSDARWAAGWAEDSVPQLYLAREAYDGVVGGRLAQPARLSPALLRRLAEPLYGLYRDLADRLVSTGEVELGLCHRRHLIDLLRGLTGKDETAGPRLAASMSALVFDLRTYDRVDEAALIADELASLPDADRAAAADLTRGAPPGSRIERWTPLDSAAAYAVRAAGGAELAARAEEVRREAAARLAEERVAALRLEAERAVVVAAEVARRRERQAEADRLAAEQEAARLAEEERLATERAEAERAEAERREAEEEAERQLIKRRREERIEEHRLEQERIAAERLAAEQAEAERRAAAERAADPMEAERQELERLAAELAELDRAEQEAARLAAEREEAEQVEAERIAAERIEAERIEAERVEAERVEAERMSEREETARIEAERIEVARLAAARAAEERAKAESWEARRREEQRLEIERAEAARAERARVEAERSQTERSQADRVAAQLAASDSGIFDQAARAEAERIAYERGPAGPLEHSRRVAGWYSDDRPPREAVEQGWQPGQPDQAGPGDEADGRSAPGLAEEAESLTTPSDSGAEPASSRQPASLPDEGPAEPVGVSESVEPTVPVERVEPTVVPVEPVEPTAPVERVEPTAPAEPVAPVPVEPVEDELDLAYRSWRESKERGDRKAARAYIENVVVLLRPRAAQRPAEFGSRLVQALDELSSARLRAGDLWGSRAAAKEAKALARALAQL